MCSLQCFGEMEKPRVEKSMPDDLFKLFCKKKLWDVAFLVDGKRVMAHRIVLAAQSRVLRNLMDGWNPNKEPISIDVIDNQSFFDILR